MSQTVQTVLGPIPLEAMGLTLMHEHLLLDASPWHHPPQQASRMALRDALISPAILGELRMDPFVNLHNMKMYDLETAVAEVGQFADLGGRTVVDPTCRGIGRDPRALQAISRRTGLQVVMGCGYYLEPTHPAQVKRMTVQEICQEIVRDLQEGVDGSGVRAGFIGEIGVGASFTAEEEKSLRGAARAQALTGAMLMVHLPAWQRHAHRVLDVVGEEGGNPSQTVLCHMNPSWRDLEYQTSLADRGAFLEYDMISMDFFYADQQAQCPSDEDNATAIKTLVDAGYLERLLLSHDVFLNMMLTRYGGFGYGYILRHFVPRLYRHGLSQAQVQILLEENPKRAFTRLPSSPKLKG